MGYKQAYRDRMSLCPNLFIIPSKTAATIVSILGYQLEVLRVQSTISSRYFYYRADLFSIQYYLENKFQLYKSIAHNLFKGSEHLSRPRTCLLMITSLAPKSVFGWDVDGGGKGRIGQVITAGSPRVGNEWNINMLET